jgi:hypothetical protein
MELTEQPRLLEQQLRRRVDEAAQAAALLPHKMAQAVFRQVLALKQEEQVTQKVVAMAGGHGFRYGA